MSSLAAFLQLKEKVGVTTHQILAILTDSLTISLQFDQNPTAKIAGFKCFYLQLQERPSVSTRSFSISISCVLQIPFMDAHQPNGVHWFFFLLPTRERTLWSVIVLSSVESFDQCTVKQQCWYSHLDPLFRLFWLRHKLNTHE